MVRFLLSIPISKEHVCGTCNGCLPVHEALRCFALLPALMESCFLIPSGDGCNDVCHCDIQQRCLSLRYTVTVFIEGRLLVYYCDSLVLALGVGDAANFLIVGSYEVASYFIDVVDLIAYFEAQIPLWISDGHVCVSCNGNLLSHEGSSWCQH